VMEAIGELLASAFAKQLFSPTGCHALLATAKFSTTDST